MKCTSFPTIGTKVSSLRSLGLLEQVSARKNGSDDLLKGSMRLRYGLKKLLVVYILYLHLHANHAFFGMTLY